MAEAALAAVQAVGQMVGAQVDNIFAYDQMKFQMKQATANQARQNKAILSDYTNYSLQLNSQITNLFNQVYTQTTAIEKQAIQSANAATTFFMQSGIQPGKGTAGRLANKYLGAAQENINTMNKNFNQQVSDAMDMEHNKFSATNAAIQNELDSAKSTIKASFKSTQARVIGNEISTAFAGAKAGVAFNAMGSDSGTKATAHAASPNVGTSSSIKGEYSPVKSTPIASGPSLGGSQIGGMTAINLNPNIGQTMMTPNSIGLMKVNGAPVNFGGLGLGYRNTGLVTNGWK
jgi:hypothetical protein